MVLAAGLAGASLSAQAQWLTQQITVKPGWSAVYLHVDASDRNLDQLVDADSANPITQIWLWQPPIGTVQYLTDPRSPLNGDSLWATWYRPSLGQASSFGNLIPNAAYLVYSPAATNYTWSVKGKPVPPSYAWDISGLNLLGFPTPTNAPRLDAFLAPDPASLASVVEIYQYKGGSLGGTNPVRVLSPHATFVNRGQAFWLRTPTGSSGAVANNSYFGPFQVVPPNTKGVEFGDTLSQLSLRLRNATTNNLTVTLSLLASEVAPGATVAPPRPPLLVRGELIGANLTYSFSDLSQSNLTWTLRPKGQAGSDIAIVLGLNRYAMTNHSLGTNFAGILKFTDAIGGTGISEVHVPVTAEAASTAGLWVGSALVTNVANYLKSYQKDTNSNPVLGANGAYVVTNINTEPGAVPKAYPLRLIVHHDGTNSVLLQRVYYGIRAETNVVVATTESVLDTAHLDTARRITATHLPWSAANLGWPLSGTLALGSKLVTSPAIAVSYDDQAINPFLHTYHPDHDNLKSDFQTQSDPGEESYGITREINLSFTRPGDDFTSLTTANRALSGTYEETITLDGATGSTRTFKVSGGFALTRLTTVPTLTTH